MWEENEMNEFRNDNDIVYIIQQITKICGDSPGKKVLQKMVFLMIQKGINLPYEYGLHFYGPYSATLDRETDFLCADGIINIEHSEYTHRLKINSEVEVSPSTLSTKQIEEVKSLIQHFADMSPSDLELLTTAIYAYNHLEDKSENSVKNGVVKIKGSKYSPNEIINIFNHFSYFKKAI